MQVRYPLQRKTEGMSVTTTVTVDVTLSNRGRAMDILVPGVAYNTGPVVSVDVPSTPIYRLKRPVMTGTKVKQIQRALKKKGYSPGPLDGRFGPWTRAAVLAFQASHGMLRDGEVGPVTAKALAVKLKAINKIRRPIRSSGKNHR